MAEPLRPGEPVTVVTQNFVIHTTVTASAMDGFSAYASMNASPNPFLLTDEGKTWLRGHYSLDAPEVAAARSAQALSGQSSGMATGPVVADSALREYFDKLIKAQNLPSLPLPPLLPGQQTVKTTHWTTIKHIFTKKDY